MHEGRKATIVKPQGALENRNDGTETVSEESLQPMFVATGDLNLYGHPYFLGYSVETTLKLNGRHWNAGRELMSIESKVLWIRMVPRGPLDGGDCKPAISRGSTLPMLSATPRL